MNSRIRSALLAVAAAMVALGAAQAEDWTYWRGPEYNGVSREKNLISDWSLDKKQNVLWTSDIGGRATPIVMNGRVYLNCRTPDDVNDPIEKVHAREQVVCWDAATGEVLWKDVFNVFQTDIPAPRVGWAAMVGDPETGNVFVHSVSGIFRCYTPEGQVVWEHSLYEDFGKISGYGGRTQTPIIFEDLIIVNFLALNWGKTGTPPPKDTYYAFDKRTGELRWTAAPGGKPLDTTYSTPTLAVINGRKLLIAGNGDGGIHAMVARTGEKVWSFRMSKRGLNVTPVVYNDRVYISHGEDNIDTVKFGRIQCIDATGSGDITDTHSVWRVDDVKAGYTALLVKDGILYVTADTGNLYAFDAETGEQLWIHNLGTVGKGSPVWADGKIYVMEVNGNVHILKPSREGCESLSHVVLRAAKATGVDEIYSSPAIANGRVYLVTRDRMICLGAKDVEPSSDPIPAMPPEAEPTDEIAALRLSPFETRLTDSGEVDYTLRGYDKNGRFVKEITGFDLKVDESLTDVTAADGKVTAASADKPRAGEVTATFEDLTASARLRVFPKTPWTWDFTGFQAPQVPPTWINATGKLKALDLDGDTVMSCSLDRGRPSGDFWMGPPEMSGYVVQTDVRFTEERRKLPSVGITVQRYSLIIKGNLGKLAVQSWQAHKRMAKEISFRSDPDVWYTMKMRVDVTDQGAMVRGKVWKRGEAEPEAWTIEQLDPHPNVVGSPGLYVYSLAGNVYFDNVQVMNAE